MRQRRRNKVFTVNSTVSVSGPSFSPRNESKATWRGGEFTGGCGDFVGVAGDSPPAPSPLRR
eukprot:944404-Prorocentrum_minimum.AAC.1